MKELYKKLFFIIGLILIAVAISGCVSDSGTNNQNTGTQNTISPQDQVKTTTCPYCKNIMNLTNHTEMNDWGTCKCGAVVSIENPNKTVPCDKCGGKNLMFYRASENAKEYLKCLDCGWTIDDSQY